MREPRRLPLKLVELQKIYIAALDLDEEGPGDERIKEPARCCLSRLDSARIAPGPSRRKAHGDSLMSKLNPTDGHLIAGVQVDEHRFLGRVRPAQLFQIALDPRDTENKKKLEASKELQELKEVREEVQRLFVGAKERNVPRYAQYIVDLKAGADGITPPVTLYSAKLLDIEVDPNTGMGFCQVPWEMRLVAIDGETQLAAWFEAANLDPSTKDNFVPVYVTHGRDPSWARQSFHDLNALAVRTNAALSIAMDARDALTHVTREIERRVPFFTDRVNKVRRQLGKNESDVLTISTLRGATVTFAEGIGGVKWGARPVPIKSERLPRITEVAIDWFKAVADMIGPAMEDREKTIASAPTIMAAIGAMGHELLSFDDVTQRTARRAILTERLKTVKWTREQHWEGIAGKFTPKGTLSIGGSKETAYAVYTALNDPESPAYLRIRGIQP
jgi:DGQHR domain-containing protein